MRKHHDRLLAVYPTRTGFGWALFEGPASLIDWGVAAVGKERNAGCLDRIDALIDDFKPTGLAIEAFEGPTSRRAARIQRLSRDILELASVKGVEPHVYSRNDITAYFKETGATTRHEIATAIASRTEELAHYLPPKRKIWMPEDPRMGLFNAVAVALLHYGSGAS